MEPSEGRHECHDLAESVLGPYPGALSNRPHYEAWIYIGIELAREQIAWHAALQRRLETATADQFNAVVADHLSGLYDIFARLIVIALQAKTFTFSEAKASLDEVARYLPTWFYANFNGGQWWVPRELEAHVRLRMRQRSTHWTSVALAVIASSIREAIEPANQDVPNIAVRAEESVERTSRVHVEKLRPSFDLDTIDGRTAAVAAYVNAASDALGESQPKAIIWRKARHKTSATFEDWQVCRPVSAAADTAFKRVITAWDVATPAPRPTRR